MFTSIKIKFCDQYIDDKAISTLMTKPCTVKLTEHQNLFAGDVKKTEYCTVELTEEKFQAFVYAVKNHYWYQMYIDDLPVWGKALYLLSLNSVAEI